MTIATNLDYYYGSESNQFSFFRIPRQLMTGKRFKRLSTDAKLLYGLLLDRMGLSAKNGWHDEAGRIYIYYTLKEIQTVFNCGHDKATKLLVELEGGKTGFGLIERVKQGLGRPAKIYVKRFVEHREPPKASEPQDTPDLPDTRRQDCEKAAAQTAENRKSRLRETSSQKCEKTAASYTEINQTDFNYINLSINQSLHFQDHGWIDRFDCHKEDKTQIEHCQERDPEDIVGVTEELADTSGKFRPLIRRDSTGILIGQPQEYPCQEDTPIASKPARTGFRPFLLPFQNFLGIVSGFQPKTQPSTEGPTTQ